MSCMCVSIFYCDAKTPNLGNYRTDDPPHLTNQNIILNKQFLLDKLLRNIGWVIIFLNLFLSRFSLMYRGLYIGYLL